jgi:hypothetical protein
VWGISRKYLGLAETVMVVFLNSIGVREPTHTEGTFVNWLFAHVVLCCVVLCCTSLNT